MTAVKIGVLSLTALGVCAILGAPNISKVDPTAPNVDKAIHWLVSVQGQDGGWGQDGGETSFVRTAERLESNGNDVANTAVATLALVHAGSTPVKGEYRSQVKRGVDFILRSVEDSPAEGPGRHADHRHPDPAQARTLHRHIPHLDAALRARWRNGRHAVEPARAPGSR